MPTTNQKKIWEQLLPRDDLVDLFTQDSKGEFAYVAAVYRFGKTWFLSRWIKKAMLGKCAVFFILMYADS
jgi:hypothetical protein